MAVFVAEKAVFHYDNSIFPPVAQLVSQSARTRHRAGCLVEESPLATQSTTRLFRKASKEKRWEKLLAVAEDPIVSSDIMGDPHAAVIDPEMTRVVDGNLVKVLSWYDNEMGYTHSLVEHVVKMAEMCK